MRILFLDVDGVLNSHDWARRRPSREQFAIERDISPEPSRHNLIVWAQRSIDPDAVERLNRLVERSGARIVVSSTWRLMYPLPRFELILRERGFRGPPLLGTTPDKSVMPMPPAKLGVVDRFQLRRGDEIHAWIELHGGVVTARDIVILDDDSDMDPYLDRLVQTDHETGLTDADVERALKLWGRPHEPHEYSEATNGNDCSICGEGYCYYLHTDRPEYEP